MSKHFVSAENIFDEWVESLRSGKAADPWPVGRGFHPVDLQPGRVVMLGGPPAAGKTALAMQWTTDLLREKEDVRALVVNVEMPPQVLLDRQLSRLSGLPGEVVKNREFHGYEDRLEAGLAELRRIASRLAFYTGPLDLGNILTGLQEYHGNLLVLNYIQRLHADSKSGDKDQRLQLDALMTKVREVASSGYVVLLISAMARQKGKSGSSYDELGIASYRGSSEIEYGADSAWILQDENGSALGSVLHCVKNRHGETPSLALDFAKSTQGFSVRETGSDGVDPSKRGHVAAPRGGK